ncbi:putative E3 ubiquitin-protein ligase ARI8 [Hordeum vulgare]|nr:putative E3 ubiquitin-protein ligase ARI8 [Hordeum vulgare]
MGAYQPDAPQVIKDFFHSTHKDVWRTLYKPQQEWSTADEDVGLDAKTPPNEDWLAKDEKIDSPNPLPEGPTSAFLTAMLVPVP